MKRHARSAAQNGTSRIPSLDGLRAISIGMVLAAHVVGSIPVLKNRPLLAYTIFNGNRGVSVFFVISGFLITSLLLKEEQVTGKILVKDFYIRRVFRILPPFWVFLAVVAVLWKLGTIETSWSNLGLAFAFLRDYIRGDWWTGHSWSLSVEEQFYLLWPAVLFFMGRQKSLWIASGLIFAAPAVRVLSHVLITGKLGPIENFMFHMRVDSLMFGCALAIVYPTATFARISERILKWPGMLAAFSFFFFFSGYLNLRFEGYYMLPFGYTLESIAISYLLLYFVTKPSSIGGRVLNSKLLVHIGLISYSLYLWQQLFLASAPDALNHWSTSLLGKLPFNLAVSFLAAELSWRLVEKPALKLRSWFERTKSPRPEPDLDKLTVLPSDSAEIAS
jgi:peptidoglycan/LPS O-acetylase OafA/YrhL